MLNVADMRRSSGLKPASGNRKYDREFVSVAPDAKSVFLSGSFNNGDTHSLSMAKNKQGQWKRTVSQPQMKAAISGGR